MNHRLIWSLVILCAALTSAEAAPAEIAWPTVQLETKPWTRWWWLGNIADEKSITAEMESYAAAGLGGLELTPIYGVRGYEDRFVPFLSPAWMRNFEHVLAEGRRLGLGIDLANGTGWPFGGPWLNETDVAHHLAHRVYAVAAGQQLQETVNLVSPAVLRFAGSKQVPLSELKQPITANANLQDLAIDQVRFASPLPLVSLMAFPEQGAPLDLTARVNSGGRLEWTAPANQGGWTLYALFQSQHGKMVERAAPGAEGFALDHLSSSALAHYLVKFDDAFKGRDLTGLRGFFNDSYEVDDAQGQSDFTPAFFREFQQRRGYDLRTHLPDLFSARISDTSTRVLSDYRETVSDLLRDEFTVPWRSWAAGHDALIRNQSHGSPANILDLYAASDIPEQEGNDIIAIKHASSVTHVTGKPLASAEVGTWLNEHFLSTLAELKTSVDTFLLSGVNHICYHGTAFSLPDEPWPGFQFYASVELNPRNPFWSDFELVNTYVTRAQSFLQAGLPDEDVLLYYNIHDRWAVRGDGSLPHFHGDERDGLGARETAIALRAAGLGFDLVSDRLLQGVAIRSAPGEGRVAKGAVTLQAGNANYRAIVIPPTTLMPEATLEHLINLAEGGAIILVVEHLPKDAPGLQRNTDNVSRLLARINANAVERGGVLDASVGSGHFLIAPHLAALLAARPDFPVENFGVKGLEFVRRRTADGHAYFFVNRGERAIESWIRLLAPGSSAAFFDPMSGRSGLAALRPASGSPGADVYLQLAPGESIIVQLREEKFVGSPWAYWKLDGQPQALTGDWTLTFQRGGPVLPPPAKLKSLVSWTTLNDEAGRVFSGTGAYTLTFPRPRGNTAAWKLDLGVVADSARVSLNGREIAGLVQAPWSVVIPTSELQDQNELAITVTNLAANRIADLDRRGVPWKKFYNINMPARLRENTGTDKLFTAAHWKPRNSGLLGPVTLTPLRAFHPEDAASSTAREP